MQPKSRIRSRRRPDALSSGERAGRTPDHLLAGGVGLRRGRRDPEGPTVGSPLDFRRVEAYEPDRLLRRRAEMRMPGRARLRFEVDGDERCSRIRQAAIFHPVGLAGLLYRYALLPLHKLVLQGMLDGIAQRASVTLEPIRIEERVR